MRPRAWLRLFHITDTVEASRMRPLTGPTVCPGVCYKVAVSSWCAEAYSGTVRRHKSFIMRFYTLNTTQLCPQDCPPYLLPVLAQPCQHDVTLRSAGLNTRKMVRYMIQQGSNACPAAHQQRQSATAHLPQTDRKRSMCSARLLRTLRKITSMRMMRVTRPAAEHFKHPVTGPVLCMLCFLQVG